MDELVTMKSFDWEGSEVWQGEAELTFGESPVEELTSIAPREMIGGVLPERGRHVAAAGRYLERWPRA